jgi:mobilome CxxCx(11)CxxC protein
MIENPIDQLKISCWNKALESFGTAYIFEERAKKYRSLLRILSISGLIVPLLAGYFVLSFGEVVLPKLLYIVAGLIGLGQLIASLFSLVEGWEEQYRYSIESLNANYKLSKNFKKLAERPPESLSEFKHKLEILENSDELISGKDLQQSIKAKERRKGMRAALREFNRRCSNCEKVPVSMKPSDCPVCGNF